MSGVELDPDHAVRMASNTKTYVAAAILRLVEDGTLGLEDPISKHIAQDNTDALRTGGYDVESITVLHLLSHTSGLYDYATDPLYADAVTGDPAHHWTRTEQLHFALRHGKPYAMPGEEFHYADTGYILLGEIVERVSATPLALALRELIGYERLGLDGTWLETLEPVPAGVTDRAHQFIDEVDTYACDYGLGISAIEDAGVRGWGHNGFWNTFSYHYPDLDATIAGSISQRQAFDVTDVLRREAIAVLS
ncbi:MAG: serine hydrolase domain-containing protein [Jiangellaceae bacterium]